MMHYIFPVSIRNHYHSCSSNAIFAMKSEKKKVSMWTGFAKHLLSIRFGLCTVAPVKRTICVSQKKSHLSLAGYPITYGMYCILYSSSRVDRTSSGSWPDTLMAYMPGT